MGGMPYHLEKGPMFATIEAMYRDRARLRQFLHDLWHGTALGSHGVLSSTSADGGNGVNSTGAQRLQSMREKWFGDVAGAPQPAWGANHPVENRPTYSTGYWSNYYGDVRAIMTETLTRARGGLPRRRAAGESSDRANAGRHTPLAGRILLEVRSATIRGLGHVA